MFKPKRSTLVILVFVLAALLTFSVSMQVFASSNTIANPTDALFTNVYNQVSPSVVSINVVAQSNNNIFGQDQTVIGSGTGFVIDNEGHIMTNNHVVDGATEIEVSFIDGTLARASVVGLDPDSDLAVIKVDLPADYLAQLQPVHFGDSSALEIGQTVLAIGSPYGQRWTLTSGIVSAVDRNIQGLTNFSIGGVIQTDAAINPGNSGGPLLNLDGEVIGVNSQIISNSHSSAGIGFAIPGNLARDVAQDLINQGFVQYSYLGISGIDVFLGLIENYNLPNNTQGAVIGEAIPGSPASRAGLQSAHFAASDSNTPTTVRDVPDSVDIITAINGEQISSFGDLISYLAIQTKPGDVVSLSVLRLDSTGAHQIELSATLTPRP